MLAIKWKKSIVRQVDMYIPSISLYTLQHPVCVVLHDRYMYANINLRHKCVAFAERASAILPEDRKSLIECLHIET